jgi:hypothetical protein
MTRDWWNEHSVGAAGRQPFILVCRAMMSTGILPVDSDFSALSSESRMAI